MLWPKLFREGQRQFRHRRDSAYCTKRRSASGVFHVSFHPFIHLSNCCKVHAQQLQLLCVTCQGRVCVCVVLCEWEKLNTLFHCRRVSTYRWIWSFWREVRIPKWERVATDLCWQSGGANLNFRGVRCLKKVHRENFKLLVLGSISSRALYNLRLIS